MKESIKKLYRKDKNLAFQVAKAMGYSITISKKKKLKDVLPSEALYGEYEGARFLKYLDYDVLEEIKKWDPRFPFKEKNIYIWWIIENNIAVGWNENPAKGWSFPVKKLKTKASTSAKLPKKLLEDAVKAMQLYLGSVDKSRMRDQQKLYNKVNKLVDRIANKLNMDLKSVWDQIEKEALKRGKHIPIPGKDI